MDSEETSETATATAPEVASSESTGEPAPEPAASEAPAAPEPEAAAEPAPEPAIAAPAAAASPAPAETMNPILRFLVIAVCVFCLAVLLHACLTGSIAMDEKGDIYIR